MKGKIIKGIAGFYYVHDGKESIYECKARGILRSRGIKPMVGDNVEFDIIDEEKKLGSLEDICARKNSLLRPVTANVDQALIIFAAREPEPNFNLLDHFLILMQQQNCETGICFNKADQVTEEEKEKLRNVYREAGVSVCFVSTYTGEGLDQLKMHLQGKTTVLAGPSGVGKSSLLNTLVGEEHMETGLLSRKLSRGKHTTRHSEIFCSGENTYLVDTPGFTALTLEDLEAEEVREYFPEFMPYWNMCRFRGCVHVNEPDCRIKAEVAAGRISRERYESYVQIYEECRDRRKY